MSEREKEILPIILAGGSGLRLWPLSTNEAPKPLHRLGAGSPLLASALDRASSLKGAAPPVLTCSATMRDQVEGIIAAAESRPNFVLTEPVSRGTGTAAAFATAASVAQPGVDPAWDPVILIMPSDHVIQDKEIFLQTLEQGHQQAREGRITLFGVAPDRIEPAFGCLICGEPMVAENPEVREVRRFDLPEPENAATCQGDNESWWNSGIVMVRASLLLAEFERQYPGALARCRKFAQQKRGPTRLLVPTKESFARLPNTSLDCLVKNAAAPVVMVVLRSGWSDVGNWRLLYESLAKDKAGNVTSGDVHSLGNRNSLVVSTGRKIAVMGLTGVAIIETEDALLVVAMERANDIKELVAMANRSDGLQGE